MRTNREILALGVCASVVAVAMFLLATSPAVSVRAAGADINPPAFDFSDDFYTKNGIRVDKITTINPPTHGDGRVGFDGEARRSGPDGEFGTVPSQWGGRYNWVIDNPSINTDPTRNTTRVTQTTGGFDKDGNLIYYNIYGTVADETFFTVGSDGKPTPEALLARALADQFRAFIFPQQRKKDPATGNFVLTSTPCGPVPVQPCVTLAPPPGNRRQDNLFDTQNGYFCQNLLGLWLLTMVVYTQDAFNTPDGQAALRDLEARNGATLDGTPVLERTEEIDALEKRGFVKLFFLPPEPHSGAPRWVI